MDDIENLLRELSTGSFTERLGAARTLSTVVSDEHVERLRHLRRSESDPWVRAAIDDAIGRAKKGATNDAGGLEWRAQASNRDRILIEAEALNSAARMLIHEARPLVQAIQLAARASSGIGDSRLADAISRLTELLVTFERLASASTSPRYEEFDLRDCALDAIAECGAVDSHTVIVRAEPLIARCDQQLLKLALTNLIRNALEATPDALNHPAIVNFGQTDLETWIVVLDQGGGLPGGDPFRPGGTTKSKKEHFGFGLTIARRAVLSFDGQISLAPRMSGGTSAEIRWSAPAEGAAE